MPEQILMQARNVWMGTAPSLKIFSMSFSGLKQQHDSFKKRCSVKTQLVFTFILSNLAKCFECFRWDFSWCQPHLPTLILQHAPLGHHRGRRHLSTTLKKRGRTTKRKDMLNISILEEEQRRTTTKNNNSHIKNLETKTNITNNKFDNKKRLKQKNTEICLKAFNMENKRFFSEPPRPSLSTSPTTRTGCSAVKLLESSRWTMRVVDFMKTKCWHKKRENKNDKRTEKTLQKWKENTSCDFSVVILWWQVAKRYHLPS